MSANPDEGGVPWLSWKRVLTAVAAVLALLLVEPQLYLLKAYSIPLVIAAGFGGFLARRSVLDGICYFAAHLLCVYWTEPIAGPQMLACLSFGLLALSGRPRFSLLTGSSLFGLLLFSIQMKYRFAGSVLTWQDVRYFFQQFGDNVGVMASQPTLLTYAGVAALALTGGAVLLWKLDGQGDGLPWRSAPTRAYLARGLHVLMALWCASALDDASVRLSQRSAWTFSEATASIPVSTFLSTVHLEPRADYRKVDTRQFTLDAASVAARAGGTTRLADVVVFLQESQFNPLAITPCPASLCGLKVFEAPKGTTDHGELRVHTYGGGTWLSEFALASGVPHRLYGPAGEFASFNVAPGVNRSFIRSLKAAGYHTVAVYPVRGGMMNARMAYRAYGFDEFFDSEDLGLPGRFDTPDSLIHAAAMKALHSAQQHGKPVYLLALTIFNHAQHGIRMERVPAGLVAAARESFAVQAEADNLADFVWRSREFEKAYQKTSEAVLGAGRPSVLAWFGDHQPPFGNAPEVRKSIRASSAGTAVPDRFVTWYNIATNLGHERPGDPRRLDIVFLPGLLAQRAGVPLDDWLAANVLARERCGGLLSECREPGLRDAYLSYLLGDLHAIQ